MSISSGTAGGITIPARHLSLLDLFTDFYGTHKRLKEFLEKFHQPHTQSDQLAEELRGISLGDFYKYNFRKYILTSNKYFICNSFYINMH